ncbi:class I SAM-dependent methyltransferase [Pseudomonas sp. MDMC216]|nr:MULTISPECIES: class I SAM-dependent methyltransferase [unclassified Pseudomonas]MBA4681352.1 class I SAM-dependent methyltransferase [Pseudomonas sp.]MDI5992564.1 class I SAM-dependent methyltransferase [Pseudomonas sp. MDMC216]MDI6008554.1 class I SAM-dependent methyltransferase [Pseudomonas sp. MDMC17]
MIIDDSPEHAPSTSGYGLVDNAEYLMRCQVDTPNNVVSIAWKIVHKYREEFNYVLDAGAGDGRFARQGVYKKYFGYEIDPKRISLAELPENASLIKACAFSQADFRQYDLSIGNPPYVRHHDLGDEWRQNISSWIESRTGQRPSGLSNAYLYFLWLSLIVTNDTGLIALVVPFEWVERPAAKRLRDFIASNGWALDVYKFDEDPFPRVLTTASITIIDKSKSSGLVRFYAIDSQGEVRNIESSTKSEKLPLSYQARSGVTYAQRGLSPGGQKIFVLTEEQRAKFKLVEGKDVVPCVTTLKHMDGTVERLDRETFFQEYVDKGRRCWLISSRRPISPQLEKYLSSISPDERDNYTCNKRAIWWEYSPAPAPAILYSSGFRGDSPKFLHNEIGAIAVGSVCGIHSSDENAIKRVSAALKVASLGSEVVPVSRGFTKIEVNQMNTFIARVV